MIQVVSVLIKKITNSNASVNKVINIFYIKVNIYNTSTYLPSDPHWNRNPDLWQLICGHLHI